MSEESIQFFANLNGFVSVKKLKINDKVPLSDVIEYFASLQFTCNNKIDEYLEKYMDLDEVNKYIKDNKLLSLDLTSFLKELNSRKLKTIINKQIPDSLAKKNKKHYAEAVKVYIFNKYTTENKNIFGYHNIIFPSKKKIMKKK